MISERFYFSQNGLLFDMYAPIVFQTMEMWLFLENIKKDMHTEHCVKYLRRGIFSFKIRVDWNLVGPTPSLGWPKKPVQLGLNKWGLWQKC